MEQQQIRIHQRVLQGIERLSDPNRREKKDLLWIFNGYDAHTNDEGILDRRSLQYLVDFLDNGIHEVTELDLCYVALQAHPSDGGLDVLRSFFARSDTTLTKVTLTHCTFGTAEDTSQLLAAFQTNRTVVDLTIQDFKNLQGAALGNVLSSLMQNMLRLQRLCCSGLSFGNLRVEEGVLAMQPGLRSNRTLKELHLSWCQLGDDGIRLIADALVGNATIQMLDIRENNITSVGLDDITRLIESTRLQTIDLEDNEGVNDDNDANRHFLTALHKNTTIQELRMPGHEHGEMQTAANIVCARNHSLAHADLLLAPPLITLQLHHQPPPPNGTTTTATATTMWIKTCHKAVTKFATVPTNTGASAIFKLFSARPQLLEKRLKRPVAATTTAAATATTATTAAVSHGPLNGGGNGSTINNNSNPAVTASSSSINGRQKRQRL